MLNSGYSVDVLDLHSCTGTMIIPYQATLKKGCASSTVTVKVIHIQYTASPPVNRTGDFNRLKIEAVLSSSIRES